MDGNTADDTVEEPTSDVGRSGLVAPVTAGVLVLLVVGAVGGFMGWKRKSQQKSTAQYISTPSDV